MVYCLFKGCRPVPPTPNIVVDMTRGGLAMKLEAVMFVDSGVLEGCPVQRTHFRTTCPPNPGANVALESTIKNIGFGLNIKNIGFSLNIGFGLNLALIWYENHIVVVRSSSKKTI